MPESLFALKLHSTRNSLQVVMIEGARCQQRRRDRDRLRDHLLRWFSVPWTTLRSIVVRAAARAAALECLS